MGKLTTFEIMVENRGAVVKAGDTLRGQLLVELSEDMNVSEVRISFTGRGHVQWAGPPEQTSLADTQMSVMDREQADEVYVNHVVTLFPPTPQDGGRKPRQVKLSRGSHMYDFEFAVPVTCPSSFSGVHGCVCYLLKAVVERAWKVDFNMRTVTVESDLDLSTIPEARDPVDLSGDLHIYNMFFHSGDCHATLRLPRKGVVPGDIIPAEFSVHNGSHQELHKVSLHLKMIVIYMARGQRCTMEVALGKVHLGKVPAGKTLEGRERGLRVPHNCPPSGLPGCAIISVQYKLELKVKPALLSLRRLKLAADIIVGTRSVHLTPLQDKPPDYWSCCPPSYEDVITTSPWSLPLTSTSFPATAAHGATGEATDIPVIATGEATAIPVTASAPSHTFPQARLRSPPFNDEPRLTVLRQSRTPSTEEALDRQPHNVQPLLRPRANTGPTARMARVRGGGR